jgi:hypothetical protein
MREWRRRQTRDADVFLSAYRFLQLLVLAATELPDSTHAVQLVLDPGG